MVLHRRIKRHRLIRRKGRVIHPRNLLGRRQMVQILCQVVELRLGRVQLPLLVLQFLPLLELVQLPLELFVLPLQPLQLLLPLVVVVDVLLGSVVEVLGLPVLPGVVPSERFLYEFRLLVEEHCVSSFEFCFCFEL